MRNSLTVIMLLFAIGATAQMVSNSPSRSVCKDINRLMFKTGTSVRDLALSSGIKEDRVRDIAYGKVVPSKGEMKAMTKRLKAVLVFDSNEWHMVQEPFASICNSLAEFDDGRYAFVTGIDCDCDLMKYEVSSKRNLEQLLIWAEEKPYSIAIKQPIQP